MEVVQLHGPLYCVLELLLCGGVRLEYFEIADWYSIKVHEVYRLPHCFLHAFYNIFLLYEE